MQEEIVIVLDRNNTPNLAYAKTFHGHEPHSPEDNFFRYFRHPGIMGSTVCEICKQYIHYHAFIDCGGPGIMVCPGETVYARVDDARVYSRTAIDKFTVHQFEEFDELKSEHKETKLSRLRDRLVADYHRAKHNMKVMDKVFCRLNPQDKEQMAPDKEANPMSANHLGSMLQKPVKEKMIFRKQDSSTFEKFRS